MLESTLITALLAALLFAIACKKNLKLAKKGTKTGIKMLVNMLPLLVSAFIVAGLLEVVIPPKLVSNLLGENSGIKGILLGSAAGALIPGGPYVAFPIIFSIHRAGAGIATTVSFIAGWSMWNIGNWPYEVALISPLFTAIRIASTLVLPPIAGLVASFLIKFL